MASASVLRLRRHHLARYSHVTASSLRHMNRFNASLSSVQPVATDTLNRYSNNALAGFLRPRRASFIFLVSLSNIRLLALFSYPSGYHLSWSIIQPNPAACSPLLTPQVPHCPCLSCTGLIPRLPLQRLNMIRDATFQTDSVNRNKKHAENSTPNSWYLWDGPSRLAPPNASNFHIVAKQRTQKTPRSNSPWNPPFFSMAAIRIRCNGMSFAS